MKNFQLTSRIKKVKPLIELNSLLQRLNMPARYRSAVIDHFSMIFIVMGACMPLLIFVVYTAIRDGYPASNEDYLWTSIDVCLAPALYLNKDVLLGQSIGKRICGLQITDRATQMRANSFKCAIRNITIFLWPLELIMILITTNRRLGDFIVNTEITPTIESEDISFPWLQIIICLLLGTRTGASLPALSGVRARLVSYNATSLQTGEIKSELCPSRCFR